MPRLKEDQREQIRIETRQRLIQAAIEEFARLGYDQANINHISESAGYAKGTVYNYFPSKQALMFAVIEQLGQAHYDYLAGRVRSETQAARRLERFFEAGFAYVADHPAEARVLITTLYGADAEFEARMAQAYLPMFHLVGEDVLAYGAQRGEFAVDQPMSAASLILSLYMGTSSRVDAQGKPLTDPRLVSDFALRAVRAPAEAGM